jgi:hypothetical protein
MVAEVGEMKAAQVTYTTYESAPRATDMIHAMKTLKQMGEMCKFSREIYQTRPVDVINQPRPAGLTNWPTLAGNFLARQLNRHLKKTNDENWKVLTIKTMKRFCPVLKAE